MISKFDRLFDLDFEFKILFNDGLGQRLTGTNRLKPAETDYLLHKIQLIAIIIIYYLPDGPVLDRKAIQQFYMTTPASGVSLGKSGDCIDSSGRHAHADPAHLSPVRSPCPDTLAATTDPSDFYM